MISTKERLAQKLHSLALLDLEREARAGDFDDYESSKHALPKAELILRLTKEMASARAEYAWLGPQILELIEAVKSGAYDNTKEEAEAWFKREGKDLLRKDRWQ